MNGELVRRSAQHLAGQMLLAETAANPEQVIADLFVRVYSREAAGNEISTVRKFWESQAESLKNKPISANQLPSPFPKFADPAQAMALVDLCHALLTTNEFLYVD